MKRILSLILVAVLAFACFSCGNTDDPAKKSEGVMTYAEYEAAAIDSEVTIEAYVQAKQGYWEKDGQGLATIYAQDLDGAYFIYELACEEADADVAQQHGAAEAILHRNGVVTECAHSNVSILKNGVLHTAPLNAYILPGTARAHLIAKCRELEIPVCEEAFTLAQMMAADEIIVTSSGAFCVPVSHVDGTPVGGGAPALLRKLQDALVADFLRETE